MRRLVTRLTLDMLTLVMATTLIAVASTQVGVFWYVRSLPPDLREGLKAQVTDPRGEVRQDVAGGLREALRNANLIGVALAAVVAAGFARFAAKRVAKPIEQVSRASVEVAAGDLSVRVPEADKTGGPEIATLNRNFNQMIAALQTYERERRDIVASIAHDLRTPLSAIQIRLELLKERVVPYSEAEVDLLLGQTQLLGGLVNDLRTLSLVDTGKLSLNLQKIEPSGCAETALSSYAHRAAEKGVELRFDRPERDVYIVADAQRLTQVLGNLLANALHATPGGGTVRLSLREENGAATLSVEDDGPGIPDTLLPYVFDRFVQGKDKTGSSGLGLTIVKTLVNLHGGTVRAENRAEGGARFSLTLPAERGPHG